MLHPPLEGSRHDGERLNPGGVNIGAFGGFFKSPGIWRFDIILKRSQELIDKFSAPSESQKYLN